MLVFKNTPNVDHLEHTVTFWCMLFSMSGSKNSLLYFWVVLSRLNTIMELTRFVIWNNKQYGNTGYGVLQLKMKIDDLHFRLYAPQAYVL